MYATGIAMQDLTRMIKGKVNTDRIVMLVDACHSGAVSRDSKGMVCPANVDADALLQGWEQIVIASSVASVAKLISPMMP